MPNINVSINTRRPFGALGTGRRTLENLKSWLQAIEGGKVQSDSVIVSRNDTVALGDAAYAGQAVAGLIFSSSSGAVGATLAGTLVTVTWATSDTASMTAWCAAVRASTAVNRYVTAVNRCVAMTLASVTAGQGVSVCGVPFTAVSGTPVNPGEFDISGSNTADALSLTTAINRHPSLAGRVRAVSSSAVVVVGLLESRDPLANEVVNSYASTITINTAQNFPAHSVGLVLAMVPGVIGNEVRATASGTNVTIATDGSAGFLGQGTGGATANNITVITP